MKHKELIKQTRLTKSQLSRMFNLSYFKLGKENDKAVELITRYLKHRETILFHVFDTIEEQDSKIHANLSLIDNYVLNKLKKYLYYFGIEEIEASVFVSECQERIKQDLSLNKHYRQRILNSVYKLEQKGYLVKLETDQKINTYKLK